MSDHTFDLVIIGAGPGGYTGAIRVAQLGLNVAIVEKDKTLGGTCLNVGCIPSKALLESSELYAQAREEFETHGIQLADVKLDLEAMMLRKLGIVDDLTKGIDYLMGKNKITKFHGKGSLKSSTQVEVTSSEGEVTVLEAKNIMLATGSTPVALPGVEFDEQQIVSSTGALSLDKVPESLVVVGAGVIGLELGSVWNRLGSKVTLIEFVENIGGNVDRKLGKLFQRTLTKQGLEFKLGSKVTEIKKVEDGVQVTYEPVKGGDSETLNCSVVLVSVGRKPQSEGLGLEEVGVKVDDRGFVQINDHLQTDVPNIWAIGDLVRGPMLAHKAEEEGVAVAERIVTGYGHVNYQTVPSVIYTWPEFAWVGLNEEEAKDQGMNVNVGTFPFSANGRAKSLGMTEGQVKIIADQVTDRIVGAHILGPRASDMLAELVVAMEFGGASEDVARSFHAHPTLSEVVREAALAVEDRARQM